jgi:hypothetical protein
MGFAEKEIPNWDRSIASAIAFTFPLIKKQTSLNARFLL